MSRNFEEELRKFGDELARRVGRDGAGRHAAICLSCGIAIDGCSHDWSPGDAGLPGDLVADLRDIAGASGKDLIETTRLLLVSAVYLLAGRGGRSASIDLLELRRGIERAGFFDEPAPIVAFPVSVRTPRSPRPPESPAFAASFPPTPERRRGQTESTTDAALPILPG